MTIWIPEATKFSNFLMIGLLLISKRNKEWTLYNCRYKFQTKSYQISNSKSTHLLILLKHLKSSSIYLIDLLTEMNRLCRQMAMSMNLWTKNMNHGLITSDSFTFGLSILVLP